MKKVNLFIIAIIAMLGFTINAKAANGVSLSCNKTNIKIGETANCTVSITADVTVNTAAITLSTSEYLEISNVTPNTTAGWSASTTGTNASTGVYAFNNANGKSGQVFSFNVTLSSKASALSAGDTCGQLCISAATFNEETKLTGILQGTGTCFAPVIEEETCVGEDCNPETGAFMNYAIIIGSLLIAGAAVVVARKSTKFFRI